MRFKDRETGEIFHSIIDVGFRFCRKSRYNIDACDRCRLAEELNKRRLKAMCFDFASMNQKEAADIMGYDVLED